MAFVIPSPTEEEYVINAIVGRRPTDRGFEYLIEWELEDGSLEVSPEYSFFLEVQDYDNRYPDSETAIGDWTGF